MAFSILPCQAIVKEAAMMLNAFLQHEWTSSLVFQMLQVCCRQINKPGSEEVAEFEAAGTFSSFRVCWVKQCIVMKYGEQHRGYADTFI